MESDQEKPTVSSPTCTALLCCPFCGREINIDEVYSLDVPISGNGTHSISCCVTMTWDYLLDDYCHKNSVNRKSKTKLKLIERWNKRAP